MLTLPFDGLIPLFCRSKTSEQRLKTKNKVQRTKYKGTIYRLADY